MLKACIFATGLAGIVSEYVMATLASYLLGDAVLQWTLTVSLMLFAMGVGSRLSRFIRGALLDAFVTVELLLSVVCATSAVLAYFLSAWTTSLAPIIYGISCAIGLLIGIEIPLATRIAQRFLIPALKLMPKAMPRYIVGKRILHLPLYGIVTFN